MGELLTSDEARKLVDEYIENEGSVTSTQEILDSGAVPRLKGYMVRSGKVSDSIFGGKGEFEVEKKKYDVYVPRANHHVSSPFVKEIDGKQKEFVKVEFENPLLRTVDELCLRLMVRTDRISTHDVLRGTIPFKDQILATNHNAMRRMLEYAIGTSQIPVSGLGDNAVVIAAENLRQIGFENVLRAFMAKSSTSTSLYQHYMKGERTFCGHELPEGLFPNGPLPYVMDTPSTKSDEHDISVSPVELFHSEVCTRHQYSQIRNSSLFAFGMVHQFFYPKGVLPVDTKTEHGIDREGRIKSQDEIWTMDSSRFWKVEDYETQLKLFLEGRQSDLLEYLQRTQPGIKEKDYTVNGRVAITPVSYSKEFARGFSEGDKGYTPEQRAAIAVRYIEGIQHLLGARFEPDMRARDERVISGLQAVVNQLVVG